jgi:dienelactone hydrolase
MTRVRILAAFALALAVGAVSSAQANRQTDACNPADPETCLYVSDLDYAPGVVDGIVLVDHARGDYPVPVLVRYPIGATDRRPVVIWHHGGVTSPIGRTRSAEWGERLARAGYVVIHPSRVDAPDATPFLPECAANGITDPVLCASFYGFHRNGPQITSFLIDRLRTLENLAPVLRNRLDATRIVVAGHSGGTGAVLANAGASQQWVPGGPVYEQTDPRPIAFLASAPQGPAYAGFGSGFDEERSFVDIDRPLLMITGMGDVTGEPVPTRLTAWITSLPGNKALLWDTDPHAVHETMDTDKCDTAVRADHCRWIGSAGVAWLDAVVRGRQEARSWLASDQLATLTRGAIELHAR